jgi:hypothetical protein
MSGESRQPPTRSRRARLAGRGILPYEPAAVYAAALCGILILLAASGAGWFAEWRNLFHQAAEQPYDLAALAASSRQLLLRSVGSLVGVSLLCGWGVGWMQRRLSPPAAKRSEGSLPGSEEAAPPWFAGLLAVAAMLAFAGVTLLLSTGWMHGPNLGASRLSEAAGGVLLCLAATDLFVCAALSAWRYRRFDREQAMSPAEVAEERRAEEGAGAAKDEVAARRAGRG